MMAEIRNMEELVRQHMWEGLCYCLSDYFCCEPACLACHQHKGDPHNEDCWLKDFV